MEDLNILDTIKTLGPIPILGLGLLVLGKGLKTAKLVPTRFLPLLLPLIGAGTYPFIAENGSVPWDIPHLGLYNAIMGAAIGGLTVLVHDKLLRGFFGSKKALGDGDTEIRAKK